MFAVLIMTMFSVYLCMQLCNSQHFPFKPKPMEPKTISSLNLDAFSGRWFQMYTSSIPKESYEHNMKCIVSDVSVAATIPEWDLVELSLEFSANMNTANGPIAEVTGTAINTHFGDSPGKFRLDMDSIEKTYCILELGPVVQNDSDMYPWVIISDELRGSLFILARDVDEFRSKYEKDVLQKVREKGFIWPTNSPIKTYQDSEKCQYKPEPNHRDV